MRRSESENMELGIARSLLAMFLAILPSMVKVPVYRLAGAKLGNRVSIGFGSFVLANSFSKVSIGDYSQIGQFTWIVCSEVSIGNYTHIAPFVWIWGAGCLKVGDKCYVGPRCIINVRRNNFEMGEYAGLGPGSVAYTHGQWLPYTEGWPRTYGDIVLEDYSWVPARAFLCPGVRVGSKSIVGSGAVVTKDIPPLSFAAGVPARVIGSTTKMMNQIDEDELFERAKKIATDLPDFLGLKSTTIHLREGLEVVEFVRSKFLRKRECRLVVCKPEHVDDIVQHGFDPSRLVLFSTGSLPEEFRKRSFAWFDLKSLKCGTLSDSFAFEIWEFLRKDWCVTCTVVAGKEDS